MSIDNLLSAWQEFVKGKRSRKDVQEFQFNLMDNILSLHRDLINGLYKHGGYEEFHISDPKLRIIHKASVRDRLLHRAVYRILYPFFDRMFMPDSFSCRNNKGTHKALNRFRKFAYEVSLNNTRTCWILKCDIKKFFASIDQDILLNMLNARIADTRIVQVLRKIICSFDSGRPVRGLPLGNLTSQLFANVYMNEFDQFAKHGAKVKYYIRYADDFVVFSENRKYVEHLIPKFQDFLKKRLNLALHPDKFFIKTLSSGMDFLGWVHFSDHRILRRATKNKMLRNLRKNPKIESLNSYAGLLKHGNAGKIKESIISLFYETI